ncbi:MAG: hypothetical protein L6R42_005196 [Xanthoria sp. 1 TBL-2021]|nr:MAG: hypothetical protein L6R42_005196 [Xanthoria sp. 1 TBL-2021]
MEFPHDHAASELTDNPKRSKWMVPEKAWNASRNASDQSTFSWFDLSDKSDPPSIAAIFEVTLPPPKFPDPQSMPAGSHNRVVPCTVDAWWTPVRIWIDPKSDNSIHEDSADIVKTDISSNPQKLVGAHKITINPSWADALNPKLSGSNETLIETMITPQLTPLGPLPHVEDTVSYLLSLHIAEGLSRVSSETRLWHMPLRKIATPSIIGPNATCAVIMCQTDRVSCGPNVEENLATSGFKRITFNVTRYGYGWGSGSVAVKLANVALLLHALLCLGYATSTLWSGRTFSIAGSVGEAIALAVNSTPTKKLKNTCSGIRSLSTWKKVVVVRETRHDHVELIFEYGSDEELVGRRVVRGKRYGK